MNHTTIINNYTCCGGSCSNTHCCGTSAEKPAIQTNKMVHEVSGTGSIGDQVTWLITVFNGSDETIENLHIVDEPADSLSITTPVSLAPNGVFAVFAYNTIDQDALDAGGYANAATAVAFGVNSGLQTEHTALAIVDL